MGCVFKVEGAKRCKVMSRGYAGIMWHRLSRVSRAWRPATRGLKSRLSVDVQGSKSGYEQSQRRCVWEEIRMACQQKDDGGLDAVGSLEAGSKKEKVALRSRYVRGTLTNQSRRYLLHLPYMPIAWTSPSPQRLLSASASGYNNVLIYKASKVLYPIQTL